MPVISAAEITVPADATYGGAAETSEVAMVPGAVARACDRKALYAVVFGKAELDTAVELFTGGDVMAFIHAPRPAVSFPVFGTSPDVPAEDGG